MPMVHVATGGCHEPPRRLVYRFEDGETLPIIEQIQGAHCGEYTPMKVVIRDPAAFAKLPIVDLPVDFNREMMLVVTLGDVTSDQYNVRITRVWRDGSLIRVETRTTPPPSNAPLVRASPFCVAIVPSSDLNVAGFRTEPPSGRRTR